MVRPFLLSDAQLRRSIQVDHSQAPMELLWQKLVSGAPALIGVVGSSVAMSGGCQARYQRQLRCAHFDGVRVHKAYARGYGHMDSTMEQLLGGAARPVRGFVLQVLRNCVRHVFWQALPRVTWFSSHAVG